MTESKKPYFENLDALRFTAAFAVFVFHIGRDLLDFFTQREIFTSFQWITKITDKGALGVNFFFVLSGFLITYLMIWEFDQTGKFSYKKFLLRRTLRIWPLYFLILVLGFFLFPFLIPDYETSHNWVNYVFFLANFDEIKYGAFDNINFLTSPWSIAVEEQFYVIWGLLGTLFLKFGVQKAQRMKYAIYLLLAASVLFRIMNFDDSRTLYYHTFAVMPDLLFGCLLALLWYENPALFVGFRRMKLHQSLVIYMIGFALILTKNLVFIGALVVLERYFIALFFCFIIVDQIVHKRKFPILRLHNTALGLGKISYGLYMYHLVVMYILNKFWFSKLHFESEGTWAYVFTSLIYLISSWLLVVLISRLSYRFFEEPFLRLKSKFGY